MGFVSKEQRRMCFNWDSFHDTWILLQMGKNDCLFFIGFFSCYMDFVTCPRWKGKVVFLFVFFFHNTWILFQMKERVTFHYWVSSDNEFCLKGRKIYLCFFNWFSLHITCFFFLSKWKGIPYCMGWFLIQMKSKDCVLIGFLFILHVFPFKGKRKILFLLLVFLFIRRGKKDCIFMGCVFLLGLAPEIPEDLYHLIKTAVAIRKHLERNRKDKDSKFRLILVESRIHRLARYYKRMKKLTPVWK